MQLMRAEVRHVKDWRYRRVFKCDVNDFTLCSADCYRKFTPQGNHRSRKPPES